MCDNKHRPTHGGYPEKKDEKNCDDCITEQMDQYENCIRKLKWRIDYLESIISSNKHRVEVQARLLRIQTNRIKELKARIAYVEAEWLTQESRITELVMRER